MKKRYQLGNAPKRYSTITGRLRFFSTMRPRPRHSPMYRVNGWINQMVSK